MGNTFEKFCCNGSSTLQRGVSTDMDMGIYYNNLGRQQNTLDIRKLQRQIPALETATVKANGEKDVTHDSKNPLPQHTHQLVEVLSIL